MTYKVLVIGAGGNFGRIIAEKLSRIEGIEPIVVGRSSDIQDLAIQLDCSYWQGDAHTPDFLDVLRKHQVDLVIHTAGPFQHQAMSIAAASIEYGCHYCDLSDARYFVSKISALDREAKAKCVSALSGCSSVPTLSSAVIDRFIDRHGPDARILSIKHGITSSGKMPGLSTVQGVLEYAGATDLGFQRWSTG